MTQTSLILTREQFLALDPHYRTRVDAPVLCTRHLPSGEILRVAVPVSLVQS